MSAAGPIDAKGSESAEVVTSRVRDSSVEAICRS